MSVGHLTADPCLIYSRSGMIQARDDLVSPSEAAQHLGITPRRVYALVRDGRLRAQRVGGRLLVDGRDVEGRGFAGPSVGRPFSPRRAWALILLAAGMDPAVDVSTKSKLRRLLRERDLWSVRGRLIDRAERLDLRGHSSDIARIGADPGVIQTGVRCAAEAGFGLIAPEAPLEAYVDQATADRLIERYRLSVSRRPNVVLRVVTDEVRSWLGGPLAPRPAIALDIAEDTDPRAQDAARSALERP
jgi:excisionase family DNA binding protein